jgi:hypothetical protein
LIGWGGSSSGNCCGGAAPTSSDYRPASTWGIPKSPDAGATDLQGIL